MGESVTFERNSDHDGKWLRIQVRVTRRSSISKMSSLEIEKEKGIKRREACRSKILFAGTVTVASHQLRRLDVIEEKSSVVVLLVVSAVAISGSGREMVWTILLVGLCPTRVSVGFPKYV